MPQAYWSHCFICLQEMVGINNECVHDCTNARKHSYHQSCLDLWRNKQSSNLNIPDKACVACYHRDNNYKFDRWGIFENIQNSNHYNKYDDDDDNDEPFSDSNKIVERRCSICRELYNVNDIKQYHEHSHKDKKRYNIPITIKFLESREIKSKTVFMDRYDTVYDLKCTITNGFDTPYPIRVLYKGKELDGNSDLVKSYDIVDGSVLYAIRGTLRVPSNPPPL